MRPSTLARRDAILCAVRDGSLVTTHEVCRTICRVCADRHNADPLGPASYHCYPTIYQDLRALERAGLLHRNSVADGYPQTTWFLSATAREQFVTDELEALWVADA